MQFIFGSLILLFLNCLASASVEHTLIRRVAVFPIADANTSTSEEAWWQMRESLTKDQRFFVASRRFMVNRGVFQPRKQLKPADVIILSKILDAQALVATYVDDRQIKMRVYEGENGYLLWEGDAEFHPAIPIKDQLIRMATQLMNSFVMNIPYQSFQVIDEVVGKAVYEDDSKKLAQVFVGTGTELEVGDPVQWVQVRNDLGQAFFSTTTQVTVVAEGKVRSIKGDRAVVEIEKLKDLEDLKENSLIRFPREINRLKELYSGGDKSASLTHEYLSSEVRSAKDFSKDHNPTASTLMWILNFCGFLLLAF